MNAMLRLSILAFSLMPKSLAIITLTELIMKTVRYQIESLSKSTPLLGLCFDWSELSQTVNWLLWTQVSVFWSLLVHFFKKKKEYSKNVCVKVLFLPLWSIYLSIFMYIYLIVFLSLNMSSINCIQTSWSTYWKYSLIDTKYKHTNNIWN